MSSGAQRRLISERDCSGARCGVRLEVQSSGIFIAATQAGDWRGLALPGAEDPDQLVIILLPGNV